jgi:hypothetical protein
MKMIETKCRARHSFRGCGPIVAGLALGFGLALGCVAQESNPQSTSEAAAASTADAKMQAAKEGTQQKGAAGESDRKKQIANESAQLLDMALALKAEVDKTTKDTLSLNVIKKADEIEKLAKQVKEKMKHNSGS